MDGRRPAAERRARQAVEPLDEGAVLLLLPLLPVLLRSTARAARALVAMAAHAALALGWIAFPSPAARSTSETSDPATSQIVYRKSVDGAITGRGAT